MIPTVLDSRVQYQLNKLNGFVSERIVKKHWNKSMIFAQKRIFFNPNSVILFFLFFCGGIFLYHLYGLRQKYKREKIDGGK